MLDLNLQIFSSYNKDQDQKVPLMISTTVEEESNSFSTSTDSASSDTFITFGILKSDEDIIPPPPTETGDLFPMVGDSHWLKLCSLEGNNTEKIVKKKKNRRGPRSRSSQYRGVTFYRRTGRWESHIWDCGKQVYLGGFDTAYAAARAYDRAAIKFRGLEADINFVVDDYKHDIDKMKKLNKVEFVQTLRRESASFGRGSSKYKGLALQNCKTHDHIHHLLQTRGWDAKAMKFDAQIKGNGDNDLELSLGITSMNQSTMGLLGKQSSIYLPMTTIKPLKTIAASSGFPFISMATSSSSTSTCLDP